MNNRHHHHETTHASRPFLLLVFFRPSSFFIWSFARARPADAKKRGEHNAQ